MTDPTRLALVVDAILHPAERDRFVSACIATEPADVPALRQRIVARLAEIEASLDRFPALDADAARALVAALLSALDDFPNAPGEHRALVRGAVEYFLDAADVVDDLRDPTGFDDDIRVANAVFDAVGRADLLVQF